MHGISFCKVNYQLPENWLWLANMFEDDNIRVSFEELERLNLSSIQLADGSGAIASLSVFHSLHCLVIQHRQCLDPNTQSNPMKKKIKRWTYREYYFPNADADTGGPQRGPPPRLLCGNHAIPFNNFNKGDSTYLFQGWMG